MSAQALLVAAAGVALIYLGSRLFIGYDSYWHVFIARQDRWSHFWVEVWSNAHPPLFYLLLRTSAGLFGLNMLAYRTVSIVATIAALPLLGAVVRRSTGNRALALVAMAAYGFSYCVMTIGVEVRSYALCAAFTLAAYLCYLTWLTTPGHRLRPSTYLGFALATTAAVLSHYSTFFFIAAAIGTPVVLAIVSTDWRRRLVAKIVARRGATAVMFGMPVAAAAVLYYVHVVQWGGQLNHVPDYMYTPGRDTPVGFLLTSIGRLAGILVPGGDEYKPAFIDDRQWIALAVIGVVSLIGLARLASARTPRLVAVTVVLFVTLVAINAVAGLAARYPFGGTLRHEFYLIAFAGIAFFSLVEAALRAFPKMVRTVAPAAAACGVITSIWLWTSTFDVVTEPIFQAQMNKFRQVVPSPQSVVVDAFTFINFYMHHHDWKWELEGEWTADQAVRQVWRLSRGTAQLKLCRATAWSFDMSLRVTYSGLVECLKKSDTTRVALLRTQWNLQTPNWDTSKTAAFAATLADEVELKPLVVEASDGDVYAEFRPSTQADLVCDAPPPAPRDLHVVSNTGRTISLAWTVIGSPRVSAILEAGARPGVSDMIRKDLGRTTAYTNNDVPPRTYYVRIRNWNACGTGEPSNEIPIAVE